MRNKIKPFVVEIKKSKRGKSLESAGPQLLGVERSNIAWPDLAEFVPERRVHFAAAADIFSPASLSPPPPSAGDGPGSHVGEPAAPAARVLWVSGFEDPVEALMRQEGEQRVKRGRKPADPATRAAKLRPAPRRPSEDRREVAAPAPAPATASAGLAASAGLPMRLAEAVERKKHPRGKDLPRGERWKLRRLPRHCR